MKQLQRSALGFKPSACCAERSSKTRKFWDRWWGINIPCLIPSFKERTKKRE
jgi:hypothetical protein